MRTLLVGIAGGTGSGKTTVAGKIFAGLPPGQALLLQHDSYYRDRSHLPKEARDRINFDEPDALENDLLAEHLGRLRGGEAIDCPRYDFATHTRLPAPQRLEPRPVIIVEGILLFAVPALRDLFDLRIFVDTPDDVRLLRRLERDIHERGRTLESVAAQYLGSVRPMHELHVAPTRQHAHLIIPEGGENAPAIDVVVGRLLHGLAAVIAGPA